MKLITVLNYIKQFKVPVFHTNDISGYFNIKISNASKVLARLAKDNHIIRLKKGLWAVKDQLDPLELPNYLLSPSPAYISFQSALYYHNVIDQIPSIIYVATLHKTIKFTTPIATVSAHQIHPDFFFGYTYIEKIKMATAEKALVDVLYLSDSKSKLFGLLPEIDFDEINLEEVKKIINKIPSKRKKQIALNRFESLDL